MRQVKDIIYEVIPGFLREECIYDAVCGMDGMDNRGKVSEMYSKIKASIPLEWSTLLGTECVVNREECMPVMYVREGEEECTMNSMSVKKVYGWLIEDVFERASGGEGVEQGVSGVGGQENMDKLEHKIQHY